MGEKENQGGDSAGFGQTDLLSKPSDKTQRPPMYRVLLTNDDYTPMEFVVHVLQKFFKKSEPEAVKIMLTVHKMGKGLAGVYSYSIAETKVKQVNDYSRQFEFPLLCVCERE